MNTEIRQRFFSSKDQKWATPKGLFRRFDNVFRFKLDPCAVEKTAKCKIFFTPKTDGLKQQWHKIGNAFVNPPFSKELYIWVKKSYLESKKGIVVVMLIPARTDTRAWHDFIFPNARILFIKGRITFEDQREGVKPHSDPAFFPSALIVFGELSKGYPIKELQDLGYWMSNDFKKFDGVLLKWKGEKKLTHPL